MEQALNRSPPRAQAAAGSRAGLVIFFCLLIALSAPFQFMAIRYSGGTRDLMWSVALAALLTLVILRRPLSSLGWGWGNWRYQLASFAIPLGYCLVTYGIIWAAGWGGFYDHGFVARVRDNAGLKGWSDAAVLAYYLPTTAVFGLSGRLATALGEEIGWRGFLVPELSKSMSFAKVSLVSGLVWGAWHLPMILLGRYRNNAAPGALPVAGQVAVFFIGIVAASVIMAYLRLKSGSLWTGAIFHASNNLFNQSIFAPLTIQYPATAMFADELGLVAPIVVLPIAVLFLMKGRRELDRG